MKVLKLVFVAIVPMGVGLYILFNHSIVESKFKCSGSYATKLGTQQSDAFIKMHRYRPWVHLWSHSDGAVWVEIPNHTFDYFGQVEIQDAGISIRDQNGSPVGFLSNVGNTVSISTQKWDYNGTYIELSK